MWDQWLEKDMNLALLVEHIKPFFNETEFGTTVEKIRKGYMIRANSKIPNLKMRVTVKIMGQPSDFRVEFSAGDKGGYFSPSMIVGHLTTMFGGGYLLSRGARKREMLNKLEDDFWRHTQMQVADLVGSATYTKRQSRSPTS